MQTLTRVVFVIVAVATASSARADTRPQGYMVGAFGGWSNSFTSGAWIGAAAGGEAVIRERIGAGGEVGVLAGGGSGLVTVSVGASARFPSRSTRRTTPFVVGGYTFLEFFDGSDHGYHFGGGIEHRLNTRRGLRLEFRDVVRPRTFSSSHYWSARAGITFR